VAWLLGDYMEYKPPDFKKDSIKVIIEKSYQAFNHKFDKMEDKFTEMWKHLNDLKADHSAEKKLGKATVKAAENLDKKHETLDKKVDKIDLKVAKIDGKQVIMILMLLGGLGLLGAILGYTVFK
jgi:hemoglobin-like flavoprotein